MIDPFHDGEHEVQRITGEQDMAAMNGRLITPTIPVGAKFFLSQQVYCAIGSLSSAGEIWASVLTGPQEFASMNDDGSILRIKRADEHKVREHSPPFHVLEEGDHLGVLFIELTTRRRLRVNGYLIKCSDDELQIAVVEAYPNCPKYIQKRDVVTNTDTSFISTEIIIGDSLNAELEEWIQLADTFFVTSAHPNGPVDTSHRGGNPGFISVEEGKLRIPDYPGNSMFGTLGNFAVYPYAGLVFLDFERNRQLQLSGDVSLDLKSDLNIEQTGGTGRWWEFAPRKWAISPFSQNMSWTLPDTSPFNP